MSQKLQKVFPSTMASAGTMSGEVDLGGSFASVFLVIPTMATASNGISIFGSDAASAAGGIYRQLMHTPINSSTVTTNPYTITSSSTNCIVPINTAVMALRYVKVNTAATVQDGCLFKFICGE